MTARCTQCGGEALTAGFAHSVDCPTLLTNKYTVTAPAPKSRTEIKMETVVDGGTMQDAEDKILAPTPKYTEADLKDVLSEARGCVLDGLRDCVACETHLLKVSRALVQQAVSEERERCAKVADYFADHHAQDEITDRAARRVAAEIRRGGT